MIKTNKRNDPALLLINLSSYANAHLTFLSNQSQSLTTLLLAQK